MSTTKIALIQAVVAAVIVLVLSLLFTRMAGEPFRPIYVVAALGVPAILTLWTIFIRPNPE